MSFEQFKHIVDQFPKLKWIGMTGIGSSFLNKDYLKMLRYMKSRSVFVEFFDHFDLIDKETSRELIEMGVDKIWVSMDAATKKTYEKIRVGCNFDKVINNISDFIQLKREMNSPLPELWFHYIITSLNVYEMPQFVDLVNSLVGDKSTSAPIIYWTSLLYFEEVKDLIPEIPAKIKEEAEERAKELSIYTVWNENVTCDKPITKCTKWTEPFVLVTGHVQPCCAINEANERDFQKKYAFANLFEKSYREVWDSEKFKNFVQMIHKGRVPIVCKNCRIYDIGRSSKRG